MTEGLPGTSMTLPRKPRHEGFSGPVGGSPAALTASTAKDVVHGQIKSASAALSKSVNSTADNTVGFHKAYQQHLDEVADNVRVLSAVLKDNAGQTSFASKYPALVGGAALSLILLALQIYNVEVNDADISNIKTIVDFAVEVLGPLAAGFFVHRKVTPVPPALQGTTA